ncbi:MAG: hypothetical protein HG422_07210 [Prevotella sp.]|nr:hypothetical protein [Prevotella sp.]
MQIPIPVVFLQSYKKRRDKRLIFRKTFLSGPWAGAVSVQRVAWKGLQACCFSLPWRVFCGQILPAYRCNAGVMAAAVTLVSRPPYARATVAVQPVSRPPYFQLYGVKLFSTRKNYPLITLKSFGRISTITAT